MNDIVYWFPRKTKHLGKFTFEQDYSFGIGKLLIKFIIECHTGTKWIPTRDNFQSWLLNTYSKKFNNTTDLFISAVDAQIINEYGRFGKMKSYTLGKNAHALLNGKLKRVI